MKINNAISYGTFYIRKLLNMSIDEVIVIGHGVTLDERNGVTIGENVNFSSEVMIWTMQHDYNNSKFLVEGSPVITKDVVSYTIIGWISANKIGNRAINLDYSPSFGGGLTFV